MSNENGNSNNEAYQQWYERNRKQFNAKRRARYREDAEYRKKLLNNAKEVRKSKQETTKPAEYTMNFAQAAEHLGVTIWTLRGWRTNGYFPEPARLMGELWFTDAQVKLIGKIRDYIAKNHIRRPNEEQKDKLEDLANLIHANW